MDDDWDLHAVVRACAATITTNTTAPSASASVSTSTSAAADNPLPCFPSDLPSYDDQNPFDFSANDYHFQGLQEIYQQLCVDAPPPTAPAAMKPFPPPQPQPQPHQEIVQMKPPVLLNMPIQENVHFNVSPVMASPPQNLPVIIPPPVRRRRKNQPMKMIRQMTQEELSADSWAWRKYGQKPIKGSSYPRNYYRCSTSKGCAARKQVERSPHNPEIFVVSYSGEHTHPRPTHRSSLAGSTRNKLASPLPRGSGGSSVALPQRGAMASSSSSPAAAGSSFSPATPSMEGEAAAQNANDDVRMAEEDDADADEDDENMIMINPSDLMNDDDEMFRGFQDPDDHSSSGGGGDFFSGGVLSSPPWTPTGSAPTFNGGS